MSGRKTFVRFFTIADYEEEELWLREQHQKGWSLLKMIAPCFFVFEKCPPEDVVYRLDFKNSTETGGYLQLFRDYGWEYVGRCAGWLYFRKPSAETDSEQDGQLFSDSGSRIDMIDHVVKTRLLPLTIIFFCCVLPNLALSVRIADPLATAATVFLSAMTLLCAYLIVYCGLKLRRLRNRCGDE